ncbi:MAG: hypothetical protein GAK35_03834 [Herbaspirillum frisingense]|uniref:DUF4253 domain-containing protein n=1 Tax=Herbaspirillum frisingense TaxID=92645 RepID=A0A7V8FTI5_9BURK|nr:MAG: hypothetical protein GAK35_03834 [Herbaspirillum frisingense]
MLRKLLSLGLMMAIESGAHAQASAPDFTAVSAILHRITAAQVRPYSTRDFGRDRFNGAISVLVPPEKAEAQMLAVRRELPPNWVAFVGTTNSLASPKAEGAEIVVGPGRGPLDILDIAQTDAVNHGMVTKDLKEHLQAWQDKYGIDIRQAETDTISMTLGKMPSDLAAFSREVYEFCPDIVEQGTGTVEALEATIREHQRVFLWWD